MLVTGIFSFFPTMFSALSRSEIIILTTFDMSLANDFNFVTSKIMSFGKGLSCKALFKVHLLAVQIKTRLHKLCSLILGLQCPIRYFCFQSKFTVATFAFFISVLLLLFLFKSYLAR